MTASTRRASASTPGPTSTRRTSAVQRRCFTRARSWAPRGYASTATPTSSARAREARRPCTRTFAEVVQLCLDYGAFVDREDEEGTSPLFIACREGHADAVQLCHEHGAEVNKAKQDGWTPLCVACLNGCADAVRLLVNRGATVDWALPNGGKTPLILATLRDHFDSARLCLEFGANLDRTDDEGHTAHAVAQATMAAWLARVQRTGWKRYFSEPRYALVFLRAPRRKGGRGGGARIWARSNCWTSSFLATGQTSARGDPSRSCQTTSS